MFVRRMILAALVPALIVLMAIPLHAGDAEPLRVLTVFPSGEAPRVKQFTVTFNQPMVPLGDMKQAPGDSFMEVRPAMEGKYRWINEYTLVFKPARPLDGSTRGEIIVKAGMRSLSGAVLERDVVTSYSLPLIKLADSRPKAGAKDLGLKPEVRLVFNQPVDTDSLAGLSYFITEKGQRVSCRVKEDTEENRDRLPGGSWTALVTPAGELPPDTGLELIVEPGLTSTSGPMKSAFLFRVPFRTYGPLRVKEINGYRPNKGTVFDPESGITVVFTNEINYKDALKHLKIEPAYDLKALTADMEYPENTRHVWLPGPFKPKTMYRITITPGLKDIHGQAMTGRAQWRAPMGPALPVLDLPGRQGLLDPEDDPAYPYQTRNIKEVHIRGHFLKPEEAVPFLVKHRMHQYLYESQTDFLKDVSPADIVTLRKELPGRPDAMMVRPVRLKELFGERVGRGVMYFDLNAAETNHHKTGAPIYRRAVVQVTNIGLSAKFGRTNTLIWATDLASGRPLANVRLELRDVNNRILWRGISDGEGLCAAPGTEKLNLPKTERSYGDPLMFVLAYHGDDFSMISTTWSQGISPWNFSLAGRQPDAQAESMTWVLTGLPLYKPGDAVRFKLIRRRDEPRGLRAPENKNVHVQVHDSRGRRLRKFDLTLNRFGTASADFTLPDTAPLGSYSIRAGTSAKSLRYVGSFRVEMYRKPTFAVDLKPSIEEGLIGDEIDTDVGAVYHFGAPVKNRPLDYVVTAARAEFTTPRFKEYSFDNRMIEEDESAEPVVTVSEGKKQLDDQGRARVGFKAVPAKHPFPRDFMIEATVTDVDERTVSRRTSVRVHPASFYLGLKTDRYVTGPGEPVKVNLIAVNPKGELLPDIAADLTLYRRTWQTVRRKGVGGYYQYVSTPTDTVVETFPVTTSGRPHTLSLRVDKGGCYFIAASAADEAGRKTSSTAEFYAYGPGPAGWEHYDHDRIDLVPDKAEYRPGEAANLLIKSPFTTGTGLLTVERNGVRRHQVFTIDGPSPHLRVELTPEDSPNVYVSVLLVRGRISDVPDARGKDPGKPAFKVGYVELKVHSDRSKLKVAVSTDRPQARPGQEAEISLRVTDSTGEPQEAEVAVVVVDEALLQLASDRGYYPDRFFGAARPLAVWSADSRINLIGRRHYGLKGAAPGGGGGPEGERFRKNFVSLALFKPHVTTDAEGKALVRFKLPDNLTTFKVFAVANDPGDRFGTGTASLRVAQPVMMKPGLPNFAGIGDRFTASVVVHNQTDRPQSGTLTISGEGVSLPEQATRALTLEAGGSVEAGFPVEVPPGQEAVLRFALNMGEERDAAEFRLPLRYPNPLTSVATYGRMEKSSRKSVKLPDQADPERGQLTITLSPSLIGSLDDAFRHLQDYPHQCLEQKASRVVGDMILLAWRDRMGRPDEDFRRAKSRVQRFLNSLSAYQNYDGGYRFWGGTQASDPYLTAYVYQVLLRAQYAGFTINNLSFKRTTAYMTRLVKKNQWPQFYSERARQATEAYMVAVLAQAGQPVEALVENLYARREGMSPSELSHLLAAVHFSGKVEHTAQQIKDVTDRLFARAVITSGEVHFEEKNPVREVMASRGRTNAFALRALLIADPDNPHLTPLARWLLRNRVQGHWGDTQSNALALMALSEYLGTMERRTPNMKLKALLDGAMLSEASFTDFNDRAVTATVPNKKMEPGRKIPLDLVYAGEGTAYYAMRLSFADKKPDLKPNSAGMTLSRRYTRVRPSPGKEGAQVFGRGDIVRVDVTVLAPHQRHWVVVEDHLPAGLEPLNFDLPVAPQSLRKLLDNPSGGRPLDYYQQYWYQHLEIRHNRIVVYARRLREGVYTLSYLARAVTPGHYLAPGPTAEEMYSPEVRGQGAGVEFEIR